MESATLPWACNSIRTTDDHAGRMKHPRSLAVVAMLLAISSMWYAIQTTDEGVGRVANKRFVAHWLETSLWVDPRFMALGAAILSLIAVWVFITRRSGWDHLVSASLVLMAAVGFFFTWAATLHRGNLTRSWPQ